MANQRLWRYLVLGLCAATLMAQFPGQGRGGARQGRQGAPAEPAREYLPEELCTVTGRVSDAITGEPVKRANVSAMRMNAPGQPAVAATGDDGVYVIKDLEPGTYQVFAHRQGYVRQPYGSRKPGVFPGGRLELKPGHQATEIDIRVTPHGVISGRVTDQDGEPVANARVMPMRMATTQGVKRLMPSGNAMTNDLGEYRIFGIAPGSYRVRASPMPGMMGFGGAAPASDSDEMNVSTFYPSSLDAAGAVSLSLTPGAELTNVDIRMERRKTVRVRGRITNPPARQGRMMVAMFPDDPMESMDRFFASVDARGRFEVKGLQPGVYRLNAQTAQGGTRLFAEIPVSVGSSDVEDVELTLGTGLTVAGTVRIEGESDADVTGIRVALQGRTGGFSMAGPGMPSNPGMVAEDGTFTYTGLTPSVYTVQASIPFPGHYLKSVRAGSRDLSDFKLDLTSGSAPELEVVVSAKAAAVSGAVVGKDLNPLEGAIVVLLPDEARKDNYRLYQATGTQKGGVFDFAGIPPGEYYLLAFEELDSGVHTDYAAMRPYLTKAEKLTLRESSAETRKLDALAPPEILAP
ncbi:MAG: carboxypeptidase regulatory-like domain-containing protein [Bryobacterales bacterium]|nr:carboxypeptidase regulatory-like domain-containing protein [Bryobacterales bacterium]